MAEQQKLEGVGAAQGPGAQAQMQERGLTIGGTGEMQAVVIQLGRIADLLAQLVEYELTNPVKPQPFGGDISGSGGIGA